MSDVIDGDDTIFRDGNVSVSKTLVKAGSHSYPSNGIGSVNVVRPNHRNLILGIICAGVTVWLATTGAIEGVGLGAGLVTAAGLFASGLQVALEFRTASGNQQALTSFDGTYLRQVKDAIEEAVRRRG